MQLMTLPKEDAAAEAREIALEAELRAAEERGRELLEALEHGAEELSESKAEYSI